MLNELAKLKIHQRDMLYKDSLQTWATDQVRTIDEASAQIRPWPDKSYLHDLLQVFQAEHMIAVPKSRRMLVSWAIAVWLTWLVRYHPHHFCLVQSDTEEKAAYVVGERCAFIEQHLRDPFFEKPFRAWKTQKGLTGKLTYTGTGSTLLAIAQGADAVRMYTFSVLVMDEVEFQDQGAQALIAALPAVEKGAKIVLVSSSNGPDGVLASIAKDMGFVRWS